MQILVLVINGNSKISHHSSVVKGIDVYKDSNFLFYYENIRAKNITNSVNRLNLSLSDRSNCCKILKRKAHFFKIP